MRPSLAAQYHGWEASLKVLLETLKSHPIDGILGMKRSQNMSAVPCCVPELCPQGLAITDATGLLQAFLKGRQLLRFSCQSWSSILSRRIG